MNEAFTDQLIFGILDNGLRKRLLSTDELMFGRTTSLSVQHESVKKDSRILASGIGQLEIHSSQVKVYRENWCKVA